jgi:hypothetical protein
MTTIIKCGYADRANKALELIANGGFFNGTVYCKNANKNNTDVSIYVDGAFISLGRIWPADAAAFKTEFLQAVAMITNSTIKSETKGFATSCEEFRITGQISE